MSGGQSWAVGCYTKADDLRPDDPLVKLLLAVGYLRSCMQRRVVDRHLTAVQGIGFFAKYFELIGGVESSEALYNMGRAYHQLGLVHLAHEFYAAVLELERGRCERRALVSNRWKGPAGGGVAEAAPPEEYSEAESQSEEEIYHCEYDCGYYHADIDDVAAHEKTCVNAPDVEEFGEEFRELQPTFTHEAAFNLSLIYRASGNEALAKSILQKWCTI
jgi:tetratricopeptide (TPR) repeat protein